MTAPAAAPTLDAAPQVPEAADERRERRNSSLLISARSPDSCAMPAPYRNHTGRTPGHLGGGSEDMISFSQVPC